MTSLNNKTTPVGIPNSKTADKDKEVNSGPNSLEKLPSLKHVSPQTSLSDAVAEPILLIDHEKIKETSQHLHSGMKRSKTPSILILEASDEEYEPELETTPTTTQFLDQSSSSVKEDYKEIQNGQQQKQPSDKQMIRDDSAEDADMVMTETGGIQSIKTEDLSKEKEYFVRHFPDLASENLKGVSTCALERDVLWHGRLFMTGKYLCFYGKLFGKAAKVKVQWNEIISLEKKSSAGVFPNAIKVLTLHSKYVFSSLTKRDVLLSRMQILWDKVIKNSSPKVPIKQVATTPSNDRFQIMMHQGNSTTSIGSVYPPLEEPKPEPNILLPTSNENLSLNLFENQVQTAQDEFQNEMESKSKVVAHNEEPGRVTISRSQNVSKEIIQQRMRKKSSLNPVQQTPIVTPASSSVSLKTAEQTSLLPNKPVECGCDKHLKQFIYEDVVEGIDVRQFSSLLYESFGTEFMKEFNKSRNMEGPKFVEWQKDASGQLQREMTYMMPFKVPMMPPSTTKCFEVQKYLKKEPYVTVVEKRTKTPGVPFGDSFEVIFRLCLTYQTEKSTKVYAGLQMNFFKSLLWEGKIEKGSIEGVTNYIKDIVSLVRKKLQEDKEGFLKNLPNLEKPNIEPPSVQKEPEVETQPATVSSESKVNESIQTEVAFWKRPVFWLKSFILLFSFFVFLQSIYVYYRSFSVYSKIKTLSSQYNIPVTLLHEVLTKTLDHWLFLMQQMDLIQPLEWLKQQRWVLEKTLLLMQK